MKLVDATIEDCAFIKSIFDCDEYELYFAENETTVDEWKERFPTFSGENKIITENNEKVGWFTYEIKDLVCEIGILVVKHDKIGSGIGYRAFNSVISTLPESVKLVKLDVQQRNTHAIMFYQRYGFQIVRTEMQTVGAGKALYYNMEMSR